MNGTELIGVVGIFVGIFSTGFSAVYLKMMGMQKDITELRTKMSFVYDNLSVALDFKKKE